MSPFPFSYNKRYTKRNFCLFESNSFVCTTSVGGVNSTIFLWKKFNFLKIALIELGAFLFRKQINYVSRNKMKMFFFKFSIIFWTQNLFFFFFFLMISNFYSSETAPCIFRVTNHLHPLTFLKIFFSPSFVFCKEIKSEYRISNLNFLLGKVWEDWACLSDCHINSLQKDSSLCLKCFKGAWSTFKYAWAVHFIGWNS